MKSTRHDDVFATTRWSVVVAARGEDHAPAERALEELCSAYWYPLYAYVRRRGHSREDAEDLTQSFFAKFLERKNLAGLDAERGRFRAFLLAALKHFLANEWDKTQRKKRGGGIPHLSLDWGTADSQFQLAARATVGPDQAFDREWAVTLLARTLDDLRAQSVAEGNAAQFDLLKTYLTAGGGEAPQADIATQLGLEPGAVRAALHRLRRRYRQILRREVAETLADPAQADEELRALFAAFREN